MAKEAKKSAEELIKELDKKYGKGSVISMNADTDISELDIISTGSILLDNATGVGGVPRGRIIEIVGPESSGKTTIATHILANAQKVGKVGIIDVEHTYDFKYAMKIGLKKNNVTFSQPDNGEMSFDIMKTLAATGEYSALLLDSVAANIPKEQHEGETGQSRMARLAALMSLEIPKIVPVASNNNCLIIFLNQFRSNIGGYGNPEKPAGGDSLKYYCSMRFDVRKEIKLEDARNKTKVKVIKNKCAPPMGYAEFFIEWGEGINRTSEILDLAVESNIIKKGGAGWFTLEDGNKLQGEDNVIEFLNDNYDYKEELENRVLRILKGEVIIPIKEEISN